MKTSTLISQQLHNIVYTDSTLATQSIVQQAVESEFQLIQVNNELQILETTQQKKDVSCILLAIQQPFVKDFATIARLKSQYKTFHIPIIVLAESLTENDISLAVEMGAADYLTSPFSAGELRKRILLNVQRSTLNQMVHPLTHLAGTPVINRLIEQRLSQPLSLLYIDIDNFKSYNDYYGFARGDEVLQKMVEICARALDTLGNHTDFLGHIGGDDFIIITQPSRAEYLAEKICGDFDASAPTLYEESDIEKGYLSVANRRGTLQEFPVMSISIGIVSNEKRKLTSLLEISSIAAELKRYAKSKPCGVKGSTFVKDRRQE